VPFHRTIAPAFGDGALDSAPVLARFPDEPLQDVELRRRRARHPLVGVGIVPRCKIVRKLNVRRRSS
jgi:hypothetical protein